MIWTLNPPDERLDAERHAIRARDWLWLLLAMALALAVKAVLVSLTERPRLILLPEAVTLAAGLLIPLAVCAAKGVKLPLDEAQRGRVNTVLAGTYCGMLAVLLVSAFVLLSFVRGPGGLTLILAPVIVRVIWDRCETALFRAGLILWGGNERRRRGKKRLALLMIMLGALLAAIPVVVLLTGGRNAGEQPAMEAVNIFGWSVYVCVELCVIYGRIVSRRDQGDNITDKLEERTKREAECDEE